MSNIPRMAAYAKAFEDAYDSDEWGEVESFLTEDVVYEVGLPLLGRERVEGRDAVIAWFRDVLDRFDRRFDKRPLEVLEGPTEQGNKVRIFGSAVYRAEGVPDFLLELEETMRFRDGRIESLEDRYTGEMAEALEAHLNAHGDGLGVKWTPTSKRA